MSESLEDAAGGCMAKFVAYGLIIGGIIWVFRWIGRSIGWLAKWVCRKSVDNAGTILMVLGIVVGGVLFGKLFISLLHSMARTSRDKEEFLSLVEPRLKSLEDELQLQTRQLEAGEWKSRVSAMEKSLADANA